MSYSYSNTSTRFIGLGAWCGARRGAAPLSVSTIAPLSISSYYPLFALGYVTVHARLDHIVHFLGRLGAGGRADDDDRQGRQAAPRLVQCRHLQG